MKLIRKITFLLSLNLMLSGCSAFHIAKAIMDDKNDIKPTEKGYFEDFSRLDKTRISQIIDVPDDIEEAEKLIINTVKYAQKNKKHISIAGKKHSMGGQTTYPDGIVLNMLPFKKMSIDTEKQILHVQSGALWSDILPFIDKYNFAINVMQSDSPFSVGGSLSVNCHGWQNDSQPIASTVESLRVLLADGRILKCNRQENKELFSLVLGGYGLFGVILDVDLKLVKNERYSYNRLLVPSKNYISRYKKLIRQNKDIRMAYGRISVAPDNFLDDSIIYYMKNEPAQDNTIPPLVMEDKIDHLSRGIFRGSVANDYGKNLRWYAERDLQPLMDKKYYSRNQLMSSEVKGYVNQSNDSTDILHEYFLPPENFAKFLEFLKIRVKEYHADLLNITVRNVKEDKDTFLRYADKEMFALVLFFNYKRTPEADKNMEQMTQKLIDDALALNGRYYLPYRLHATNEQFFKSYPQADKLLELKRKYDPDMLFQNLLFVKYLSEQKMKN